MDTFKDHYEWYLTDDISLWAFVFEIFRKQSINCIELDPAHYLSVPSHSLDVMLKFTFVNLKIISDI